MIDTMERPYPRFKIVIFILMIINAAIYFTGQTLSRGLDETAWLVLLALFELETEYPQLLATQSRRLTAHTARLAAIVAIAFATVSYVSEGNGLDIVNSVLWLAVVALLEFEIRFPALVAANSGLFKSTAAALYGGLALLVPIWALRGIWLDAYDALLWLIAFATIELDLLRISDSAQKGKTSDA